MPVPEHLYIHVPFCASKCPYCAFYSETETPFADYAELVSRELELRGFAGLRWKTIYIGGGTPSLIRNSQFTIHNLQFIELTVECNPADITPEFAAQLAESGVTRVSVGAQSFDDATLRFLGRRHDSATTRAAVSGLRHAGIGNISLDLMASVPGFENSLREAADLEPEHISVYPLSIEPGTDFHKRGVKCLPDDDTMDQLAAAEDFLVSRGYGRYEISNYCKPGCECRHNLAVWRGADYAAAGPAAASRAGLERRMNIPDLRLWAEALRSGELPRGTVETLTPEEDERERFITGLRLGEGVRPDTNERVGTCIKLVHAGVMRDTGGGVYTLTRRGREVADAVAAEFI